MVLKIEILQFSEFLVRHNVSGQFFFNLNRKVNIMMSNDVNETKSLHLSVKQKFMSICEFNVYENASSNLGASNIHKINFLFCN